MNTKPHQAALDAEQSLREAVRDEFDRKAKLGQYVVINRGGKPCRVPASEALEEAEGGLRRPKEA